MFSIANYKKYLLACGCFLALGLSSCEKFNDWEIDESTDRLFRPTGLTVVVNGVGAELIWKNKPNTQSYTVELAKDSLQFAQIVASYTTEGVRDGADTRFVIPDLLDPLTLYSVRIRGENTTEGTAPSNFTAATFRTATEQLLFGLTPADIGIREVTLRWQVPNQVTHFMIGATRYDITPSEAAAGVKTITGLEPRTAYTVTLYRNANIRGTLSFTTNADLPTGPNVVYVQPTDDLATMIATSTNPNAYYVLLQGSVFNASSTIQLPENANITIWGEQGPAIPVLAFNGINLPAVAGTIRFENVDITGFTNNDPAQAKRNYIFNQSTSSNTQAIIFENCIVRNYINTPFRLQSSNPITVGTLEFNNCIIDDVGVNAGGNGTYALVHTNVATGRVNNIKITNSTVSNMGYGIILHNAAPSQSVTIENCTFFNTVGNARYFIDYNAQSMGTVSIKNNIIGKTLAPASTGRGIRPNTDLSGSNNFRTSDCVFSANQVTGLTEFAKTSAELFENPNQGIFRFLDPTYPGRTTTGDPRWR
jgi:hypothetical protein